MKEPKLTSEIKKDIYVASQSKLIWWRFKKHKLAVTGGLTLIFLYILAVFAPFWVPHDPNTRSMAYRQAPPQKIRFRHADGFSLRPFVYPLKGELDLANLEFIYKEDQENPVPIMFFARGFEYKLFGVFNSNIHFMRPADDQHPLHLFGTDELGRDMFSRVLYGARISLSIGLVGVAISLLLGIFIGGIGGYFGGKVDLYIQRLIEIFRSVPQLPLWMGLSAALPTDWPSIKLYMAITIILSLMGWTDLARVIRGKFLSLKNEDFVVAARLVGRSHLGIIFIHMLPSFTSHIIASLTLAIPGMILGETSLSFLGIGLQAPTISWGVLLQKAQNLHTIALAPWLMIPGLFVIVTVLAFNFLGDGLRDAADPYAK